MSVLSESLECWHSKLFSVEYSFVHNWSGFGKKKKKKMVSIAASHRAVTRCFFVWLSLFGMPQKFHPIYISIPFEGLTPKQMFALDFD